VVKEIQVIEEATSEEKVVDTDQTLITPNVGELLVIRRAVHVQEAHTPCEPSQREKIFHTRCTVGGKICEFIIDGGRCTNVASRTLIDKLQLPTKVYPTPYSLQWLKRGNEVTISK